MKSSFEGTAMIKLLTLFLAVTTLAACGQSKDSMCLDLANSLGEGKEQAKKIWMDNCKVMPLEAVEAQHKGLKK